MSPSPWVSTAPRDGDGSDAVRGERRAHLAPDGFVDTKVLDGAALHPGATVHGPAIIQRMGDSVVVPADFAADVDRYGTLVLRPQEASA